MFVMFLYQACLVATFMVGRTTRDTLFLQRVDLKLLPLMYVAVSLAVALASFAYSRIADSYRRDRLIGLTLITFAVLFAGLYACLALGLGGRWLYALLYVAVEATGAISMIQFWTLAADVFSAREGRRLFGLIGAGGVVANVVGGLLMGSFVSRLGAEALIPMSSLLFLTSAFLVRRATRGRENQLERAIKRRVRGQSAPQKRIAFDTHDTHLRIVAALVVVTFVVVTLVDFQFKTTVQSHFATEKSMAAWFGYFYAATGVVAGFVQFLLTGRLLERGGVVVALALLPIALLLSSTTLLVIPMSMMIVGATLAKGSENVFRYTIHEASMQLMYVPVPSDRRGQAKAFIDGVLKPSSIALVGLFLAGATQFMPTRDLIRPLSALILPLLLLWGAMILRARKSYVASLLQTLRQRRFDEDTPWRPATDEDTIRLVSGLLRSDDEAVLLNALDLVPSIGGQFSRELSALLDHSSPSVRTQALRLLAAQGSAHTGTLTTLLAAPEPEVRAAAIAAVSVASPSSIARIAPPYLSDESPLVRASAAASILLKPSPQTEPREVNAREAREVLDALERDADPAQRIALLKGLELARDFSDLAHTTGSSANATPSNGNYANVNPNPSALAELHEQLVALTHDRVAHVRVAAIETIGRLGVVEAALPLLERLSSDRGSARASIRVLTRLDPRIVEPLLLAHLKERPLSELHPDSVAGSLEVLERVGSDEALEFVVALLATQLNPRLHPQVLAGDILGCAVKAAAAIRDRTERLDLDTKLIDARLDDAIGAAYETWLTIEDLRLPPTDLLVEALFERARQELKVVFRLLEIRFASHALRTIHESLETSNKTVRANAAEIVDNILPKDISRRVLPLIDDVGSSDRARIAVSELGLVSKSQTARLKMLVASPAPWLASCALFAIGQLKLRSFGVLVSNQFQSQSALVRETADLVLARLAEGGELRLTPGAEDGPTSDVGLRSP
ncbi:MAG: MFS transporter [Deltaproteobacteria bacterium]|nr:MFS transporter [Deltaproteobacteria bacterium]